MTNNNRYHMRYTLEKKDYKDTELITKEALVSAWCREEAIQNLRYALTRNIKIWEYRKQFRLRIKDVEVL